MFFMFQYHSQAKSLVGGTWCFGISFLAYISISFTLKPREQKSTYTKELFQTANYFVTVFDFSFVGTAASAYLFIFYRYQKSRRNRCEHSVFLILKDHSKIA